MSTRSSFTMDPESLRLLQTIERQEREDDRLKAIDELSRAKSSDAARILQETFERSVWRSTKIALLKAMGHTGAERAVEFLRKVAGDADDLAMASEAILALGCTDHPVAGEFLASIIMSESHPLTREALIAVANLSYFPCDELIASIIMKASDSTPTPVLQNAIIAAGLRHQTDLLPYIETIVLGGAHSDKHSLFNTAMITLGRVGNQGTIDALEARDTRFRAFAHQLKTTAIENIRLRLGYTVEDVISQILEPRDSGARRQAFQRLRNFTPTAAREAFELLAPEAPADLQGLMRLHTAPQAAGKAKDSAFYAADFDFMLKRSAELSPIVLAAMARALYRADKDGFFVRISMDRHPKLLIHLAGRVFSSRMEGLLLGVIEGDVHANEVRIDAINALVAQPMMQIDNAEMVKRMGKKLSALAVSMDGVEGKASVRARVLRALGQMGYEGADAMTLYREGLKDSTEIRSSVYAALAMTDSEDAARIILKRLRQIAGKTESLDEVTRSLETLARLSGGLSAETDAEVLTTLPEPALVDARVPILKIMGQLTARGLERLVVSALDGGDYLEKILAVAACKNHMNADIAAKLLGLLDHDDACLRGRALDSLTAAGDASTHAALMKWVARKPEDQASLAKILKSMNPRPDENYDAVIDALDQMTQSNKAVIASSELSQAAANLRDNLLARREAGGSPSKAKAKASRAVLSQHAIDETLRKDLIGFESYSETIKTVLRSGEVICQHPELFDVRVDKSTALVQYVKSIDLLLQERVGAEIFLRQNANILQKMQSQLVRLELDAEESFGPNLVTDLQVSMFFSADTFPTHKLQSICQMIMSGRLMREQYKVIDGLRAWAILLLLFGREFKFRGTKVDPLLPMRKPGNDPIVRIARDMNELQEARNRAAHRGTMLEMGNMQEMRKVCASVLNLLNGVL